MKNLKTVKDSLKSICLTTNHLEVKDLIEKPKFWMNKYGCFALDKKEKGNFDEIANFIREKYDNGKLANDVSKKDIESFLLEFISKVITLSSQQEKLKLIDNFETDFDKQIKPQIKNYEILFPILSFNISSNFTFGDLSFYTFSKYQLNKEILFIKNLYKQNKLIEEKKEWIKFLKKELSVYLNKTMIKCKVIGTSTASHLKSYNNALLHINVLKFIVFDIVNNKPHKENKKNKIQRFDTIMKANELFKTAKYLPVVFNFKIKNLNVIKTKKAISLSKILKKEIKDDIDYRILASINWAINSIAKIPSNSDESNFFDSSVYMTPNKYLLSQCLLNILIAFETLLIFKDEQNRKEDLLKYRSIALLENTGFKRFIITKQINTAYTLRSEIIHEGKFNKSSQSIYQLYLFFRDIVFELIKLKNKENIVNNHQLKKWFLMKESFIRYDERKSEFNKSKKNK